MELIEDSPFRVQADLLDILYQFSVHFQEDSWGSTLLSTFEQYEEKLIEFYPNQNEDIQSFTEMILSQMMLANAHLSHPVGLYNRDLALEVSGIPSRRAFTHSFEDHAENITSWISDSPGLASKDPTINASGWQVYNYPARHENQWTEVQVSPAKEKAIIKIDWK